MSGYQLFVDDKRLGEALSPSTLESRLKVRTISVLRKIFSLKIKGFSEPSRQCGQFYSSVQSMRKFTKMARSARDLRYQNPPQTAIIRQLRMRTFTFGVKKKMMFSIGWIFWGTVYNNHGLISPFKQRNCR